MANLKCTICERSGRNPGGEAVDPMTGMHPSCHRARNGTPVDASTVFPGIEPGRAEVIEFRKPSAQQPGPQAESQGQRDEYRGGVGQGPDEARRPDHEDDLADLDDQDDEEGREFEDQEGDEAAEGVDQGKLKKKRAEAKAAREAVVTEFNAQYAVVNDAGKVWIFSQRYDKAMERYVWDRINQAGFRLLYLNETVTLRIESDGAAVPTSVSTFWLKHKHRRSYRAGVVFDPTTLESGNGFLNLWRGFGVQPKRGSWELMRRHIRDVICGGSDVYYEYLMGWMARMFQRPAKLGEVAVVLRGPKGTGKGALGNALRKILRQHGMRVTSPKHVTGTFNAHLRDLVYLFADEAIFAADRSIVGTLNGLITEDPLTIEGKGDNVVQGRNYLHILMASNEEWVIPASADERRYFVLDVLVTHQQDYEYFADLHAEMENGGYEAMLYDLLKYDLTGFDVRRVPQTEALQEQKKLSLNTEMQWWHTILARGYVYKSKLGVDYFNEWHDWVSTDILNASYVDFCKERGVRYQANTVMFGKFMAKLAKPARGSGEGVIGEVVAQNPLIPFSPREPMTVTKSRPTGYQLGNLSGARKGFAEVAKTTFDWGDEDQQP